MTKDLDGFKFGFRGRFFSVIDLVNKLEQEKEQGKYGNIASRLLVPSPSQQNLYEEGNVSGRRDVF